jgi:flavodoxin
MRGLVVYDSYFGNGAQVADAITAELESAGHQVRTVNLQAVKPNQKALAPVTDFLVVGGPTRMKHISRRARTFAKDLDPQLWAGKPVLVYDTYGPLSPDPAKNEGNKWLYPGGVFDLKEILAAHGLRVFAEDLRCLVVGQRGPLADEAIDDARSVARRFAEQLA